MRTANPRNPQQKGTAIQSAYSYDFDSRLTGLADTMGGVSLDASKGTGVFDVFGTSKTPVPFGRPSLRPRNPKASGCRQGPAA